MLPNLRGPLSVSTSSGLILLHRFLFSGGFLFSGSACIGGGDSLYGDLPNCMSHHDNCALQAPVALFFVNVKDR